MRIQSYQHTIDSLCDKFLVFNRFHIITFDAAENLGECA